MHSIKKAKYIKEYKILIDFGMNQNRLVDLKNHLEGEVFEPLTDVTQFKNFRVDSDIETIVWENGADMSPDFLFDIGVENHQELL
jgi:hypothetical protein